jgi:hypothetical protein
MVLNLLSRTYADGCLGLKQLIRTSHESIVLKERHRKRAFQLFRTMIDRKIVEIIPKNERTGNKVRVNISLQDDFSLNQTLSLYLLDTLKHLDPFEDVYSLNLLSLVESIIEDPKPILLKQLDQLRKQKMFEMKEEGLEYDERIAQLEKLEHPKPLREFIYHTFNEFALKHPWIGQENIAPKSIAREIYETYQSFNDYIHHYGLQRSEGLLLRHISSVYKTLVQTVPDDLKNDSVDEMILFFEVMIKQIDSSLLDEWEKLKDPSLKSLKKQTLLTPDEHLDITKQKKAFHIMIRNQIFSFIKALSYKKYDFALSLIYELNDDLEVNCSWSSQQLSQILEPYFEDHHAIDIGPNARHLKHTLFYDYTPNDTHQKIEHMIIDTQGLNDWSVIFMVNLEQSRKSQKPVLSLVSLGDASQHLFSMDKSCLPG